MPGPSLILPRLPGEGQRVRGALQPLSDHSTAFRSPCLLVPKGSPLELGPGAEARLVGREQGEGVQAAGGQGLEQGRKREGLGAPGWLSR